MTKREVFELMKEFQEKIARLEKENDDQDRRLNKLENKFEKTTLEVD